jgi:hypothetical protein
MDDAGTTLSTGKMEHTAEGLEQFMNAVRARVQTPHDVVVAIETSHGPLIGALLDQGFTVYAINPKAVERHPDRFRVAGANRTCGMRGYWPRSCGRIASNIDRLRMLVGARICPRGCRPAYRPSTAVARWQ